MAKALVAACSLYVQNENGRRGAARRVLGAKRGWAHERLHAELMLLRG
jgi:hypothetical protein